MSHLDKNQSEYLSGLLAFLRTGFSLEELKHLCFELGIDHENFSPVKQSMTRELIEYCVRHGRLEALERISYSKRPFMQSVLATKRHDKKVIRTALLNDFYRERLWPVSDVEAQILSLPYANFTSPKATKAYESLLVLLPSDLRNEFKDEMVRTFQDDCRAMYEKSGLRGIVIVWIRQLSDLLSAACQAYIDEHLSSAKEKIARK